MHGENTLPEAVRLLHIGPPKTGTTSIQAAFHDARDQLHGHGVHYAGHGRRPKEAGREFLGKAGRARGEQWEELVADVRSAGDRRVCISNESFSTADDAQAKELVQSLGGDAVHVVMVARPFDAVLPSHWQQRVRNHWLMDVSYDEWLQIVLGERTNNPHYDNFWRLYHLEDQIRRWSAAAAPERVTVVVAQEGNHSFLPSLFEEFLGLPAGLLKPPTGKTNSSLNLTGAELLRTLDGEAKDRGWTVDWYQNDLKVKLADAIRRLPRDPAERAILLPPWAAAPVSELNDRRADTLETTKVRVIGDPGSMRPDARKVAAEGSSDEVAVPLSMAAGALASAVDEFLRRERVQQRRVKRLTKRLEKAPAKVPARYRGLDNVAGRELAAELGKRVRAKVSRNR